MIRKRFQSRRMRMVEKIEASQLVQTLRAMGELEGRIVDVLLTDGDVWNRRGTVVVWTRVAERVGVSKSTILRTLNRVRESMKGEGHGDEA